MKKETYSVQALERAFNVLDAVSKSGNSAKLNEIAAMTGINKTTVYRMLNFMISLGYVKKNDLYYSLSLKFLELSGCVVNNMDFLEISKPHLKKLCALTGETIHLVMEDETEIVYIYKEESMLNSLRMVSSIGLRRPMYCTGVGKSLLATKEDDEIKKVWDKSEIKKFTPNTITEFKQLHDEIEEVRKNGYAVDKEENEIGIMCVAAAIKSSSSGISAGALSISCPAFRLTDSRLNELIPAILNTADSISSEIYFQ